MMIVVNLTPDLNVLLLILFWNDPISGFGIMTGVDSLCVHFDVHEKCLKTNSTVTAVENSRALKLVQSFLSQTSLRFLVSARRHVRPVERIVADRLKGTCSSSLSFFISYLYLTMSLSFASCKKWIPLHSSQNPTREKGSRRKLYWISFFFYNDSHTAKSLNSNSRFMGLREEENSLR